MTWQRLNRSLSVWLGVDPRFIPAFTSDIRRSQTQFRSKRVPCLAGEERQVTADGRGRVPGTEPGAGQGVRAGNTVFSCLHKSEDYKSDYLIEQCRPDLIYLCFMFFRLHLEMKSSFTFTLDQM